MKYIINKIKAGSLLAVASMAVLSACNKDLPEITGTPATPSTGLTIAATLAASPNDSLFYKLIVKGGQTALLSNPAGNLTIFVPDNTAMIASGFSNALVNALPAATAASIVNYNIYGLKYPSSSFPTTFPNVQLPTALQLDPTNPLVRMSSFPSKRGTQNYVNNIPLGTVDIAASNGIIHKPLALIAPPSRILKDTLNRVANLSLLKVALARADSGQVNLNRFDSLLNYAVTNMTLLAPSDTAFKTLINALSGGLVPLGAPNAVFTGFINTNIPVATLRGILAYHLLAAPNAAGAITPYRVFSVNISSTPMFITTLVNSSAPTHPGVLAKTTFTGPFASALTFTGLGVLGGGAPYSGAAANASLDRHAVNGVFYIIDKVLLPQ